MHRKTSEILTILLCLALFLSGCGTGLASNRATPTLVPLPRTMPVGPSRTPAQVEAATHPSPTPVPTQAETVTPVLPTSTPTPEVEPSPTPTPLMEATSSPTVAPTSSPPEAVVQADRLNVRSGPGTAYARIGQLEQGSQVEIMGRNEEGTWWQIAYPAGEDGLGWVSAEYIETDIEMAETPIVEAPAPPPTPAPRFEGKIVFQESSGGRIFTINADGSELTYLTNGLDPDWSPDGTKIVFTRWEWDPPGVFVIHADGSGEEQIVAGPKAKGPRWSPDGSHIVFTSEREESGGKVCFGPWGCFTLPKENHWKLSVLDLATGHIMDPHCDPFSFAPSWSPDSTRLVYDGVRGLRPADPLEGHDQEAAFIDYDQRDMYPVWSPTSDRIAFMFRQHDHWEIYAVNADGNGRTRLTESPLFEPPQNSVAPEWSPDGEWIAFLTDRRGKWEVWVMRPDGSQQQPLFPPDALEGIEFHYEAQSEHVLDWWMP